MAEEQRYRVEVVSAEAGVFLRNSRPMSAREILADEPLARLLRAYAHRATTEAGETMEIPGLDRTTQSPRT